jgi:hypothetical protein
MKHNSHNTKDQHKSKAGIYNSFHSISPLQQSSCLKIEQYKRENQSRTDYHNRKHYLRKSDSAPYFFYVIIFISQFAEKDLLLQP